MNYAQIRTMDISNGEGIGISLFVQGCDVIPHCKNCFNQETWDFNNGIPWTPETEKKFLDLADKPYIQRISVLGGEPLADKNVEAVVHLISEIRQRFGDSKKIWVYTGYNYDEIQKKLKTYFGGDKNWAATMYRGTVFELADYLVDGPYVDEQKDYRLKYKGSHNQRIIDLQLSKKQKSVVLWRE